MKKYFNFLISHSSKVSFIEQCSTSPLISEKAKKTAEQLFSPINNFFLEGIESGELKDMEIKLIYSFINGVIVNTAKLHLSGLLDITNDKRDIIIQACWDGLKKD